jgi:hypothetical protein
MYAYLSASSWLIITFWESYKLPFTDESIVIVDFFLYQVA